MARWSYDPTFYETKVAEKGLEIRTHPTKGKGLFATRRLQKGSVIFEERAICCSQYLDDYNAGIPVCSNCLKSLETPADIVNRVAGEVYVEKLPVVRNFSPRSRIQCRSHASSSACRSIYCSEECETVAWRRYHSLMCTGQLQGQAKASLMRFLELPWHHGLIDFSDSFFLILRAVAIALSTHRREGISLSEGFQFVSQLTQAPLSSFRLTCLLWNVYDRDCLKLESDSETREAELQRRWLHFLRYRNADSHTDPIVAWSMLDESAPREDLAISARQLAIDAFEMSSEESAFFTADRWSNAIGATLMNAHRRLPLSSSPYSEFVQAAQQENLETEILTFHRLLRSNDVDPRGFDPRSRGQAFFVVGACMNHSCDPNVRVLHNRHDDETLCLVALRDIEEGEELFISYIEETDHVFTRYQGLCEQYLFSCDCPRCAKELKEADSQYLGEVYRFEENE